MLGIGQTDGVPRNGKDSTCSWRIRGKVRGGVIQEKIDLSSIRWTAGDGCRNVDRVSGDRLVGCGSGDRDGESRDCHRHSGRRRLVARGIVRNSSEHTRPVARRARVPLDLVGSRCVCPQRHVADEKLNAGNPDVIRCRGADRDGGRNGCIRLWIGYGNGGPGGICRREIPGGGGSDPRIGVLCTVRERSGVDQHVILRDVTEVCGRIDGDDGTVDGCNSRSDRLNGGTDVGPHDDDVLAGNSGHGFGEGDDQVGVRGDAGGIIEGRVRSDNGRGGIGGLEVPCSGRRDSHKRILCSIVERSCVDQHVILRDVSEVCGRVDGDDGAVDGCGSSGNRLDDGIITDLFDDDVFACHSSHGFGEGDDQVRGRIDTGCTIRREKGGDQWRSPVGDDGELIGCGVSVACTVDCGC